jgi:hypothetical protein
MKGKNYIEAMPEDIRIKWIGNHDTHTLSIWERNEFKSFRVFINSTLVWEHTKEGFEYWERIYWSNSLVKSIERDVKLIGIGL